MRIHAASRAVRLGTALVLSLSAVAVPAARQFQTADLDSLRITLDADWAPSAAPGYFPARFEISNSGDEREIEIVGQGTRTYVGPRPLAGAGSTVIRQSVRLGTGNRVHLTIPVPIYADSENIRFEIRERGRVIYRFNYAGRQSRVAAGEASALVVVAPGSALSRITLRTTSLSVTRSAGAARGRAGTTMVAPGVAGTVVIPPSMMGPRGGAGRPLDFQLEPSRLPANWLGYTSLRAVTIGPVEWDQLTDGQKSALLAWSASGGDLIFVDGDVRSLVPSAQLHVAAGPGRASARHLFGHIHAVPLSLVESGLDSLLTATEPDRERNWALPANGAPDWGTVEKGGFRLQIPGVEGVPARAYLGILLLFSLVIGPLNYWLLRRKGRQVLVVLTAPLVSAAFIAVLAAYAVAGEGFRVVGRAVTLTMLDQVTKQAVTRGTVSLYAPGLTRAGGLRFRRDAAVWAVGPEGTGLRSRMELDLTDAQHFSSGVLQSRAPTNIEQVTFRVARERLTFSAAGDGVMVANGLDAAILALFYRQGDTVYDLNGRLSPGERGSMTAGRFDSRRVLPAGVVVPGKFFNLIQQQPPGSYLAVLERSPFWEPGVAGVSERGSLHIVLGWPEGQR